ncbi:MAG: DNA polymerase III subunit delta [Legionella sp.]|nr:DNA polymerase III subunit delta [Legionella sp.]
MLIKHSDLDFHPGKKLPAVFFLVGQEFLQVNNQAKAIKSSWQQNNSDVDLKIVHINAASDWLILEQEANSYSLFSSTVLIDARYEKKTLDATGKAVLERYLKQVNSRALLIIRAPLLPLKQLQTVVNNELVQVIYSNPPTKAVVLQWINLQLGKITLNYDKQIPALIHQYNEGNLLASAQVLEKLALTIDPNAPLTLEDVKEHLVNQCDYSLFELADSCLIGDSVKALQLLRQASGNKTEPTLILWLLTQEIRLLMQLAQSSSFRDTANQLKIWSTRISLYQRAIKKHNHDFLRSLLHYCCKLDLQIKTSQSKQIWQSFEFIALSLCAGKEVGYIG